MAAGPLRFANASLALALVATCLFAPATAGARSCGGPPGLAGLDQYCETVPGPGGNEDAPGSGQGQDQPGDGSPGTGGSETGGPSLPADTVRYLQSQGQDGQAVLALGAQKPRTAVGSGKRLDSDSGVPSQGVTSGIISSLGSGGGGDAVLVGGLALLAAGLGALWALRRRGREHLVS